MSDAVIVALITAGATLIGVILSNKSLQQTVISEMEKRLAVHEASTKIRIEELTREVRGHNDFASRIPVIEEQIKVANHRIEDLEKKQ